MAGGLSAFGVASDRQNARQAGESIAAQSIIDQLVDDDVGFVGGIAETQQCVLAELARFGYRQSQCRRNRRRIRWEREDVRSLPSCDLF